MIDHNSPRPMPGIRRGIICCRWGISAPGLIPCSSSAPVPRCPLFLALIVGGVLTGGVTASNLAQAAAVQEPAEAIAADLFQFPPATPQRVLEAAVITHKFDRFDDARAFIRQLIDRQLTANELRALWKEPGPAPFLSLNIDSRLQPEARELLRLISSANQVEPRTDEQLRILVQGLGQPGTVAADAVSELLSIGDAAVPALLSADPQTTAGRVAANLLESRTRQFRAGLLAQLESSDTATRVRILTLLGFTADSQMALRLLRWQFDQNGDAAVSEAARSAIHRLRPSQPDATSSTEAAAFLTEHAADLIRRSGARFLRHESSVAMRELTGKSPPAEAIKEAVLLLRDALTIDPTNIATSRMVLVADCASVDTSMTADATAAAGKTADELVSGLEDALKLNHSAAAIELLRGLGQVTTEQVDLTTAGIVFRKALNSPDPRVRLLAASLAKSKLSVEVSEPSVARTFLSVLRGDVRPEAVIAGADRIQSGVLRAVLEDAGYMVAESATGMEGFEVAAAQMNCELFVLSAESYHWPLTTTIANLRADVRTRNTPVIVIGPPRFETRIKALSENYDGVRFIAGPVGAETLQATAQRLKVPDHVNAAIARRNELWSLTLQRLDLPGLILTPADRESMKAWAEE